jgi:bacillithiol biosynthesis cysteine-adding enzyme BshC
MNVMNSTVFEKLYPKFAVDYTMNKGSARSFFSFSPDMNGLVQCAKQLSSSRISEGLPSILEQQNRSAGCSEKTIENIAKMNNKGCVSIVTGQQIGILGGALYVPFKVLKAIHIAEELESETGKPAVPVFWIGTNDHDYSEINHVSFMGTNDEIRTLEYKTETDPALSCGWITINDLMQELIKEYTETIRNTEFTPQIEELLLECYKPGSTLGQAFMRLSAKLYSDLGLICLDPSDPEIMDLIQPVLRRECTDLFESSQELLKQSSAEIEKDGYTVQVQTEEGRIHAFLNENGIRKALFRKGDSIVDRNGTKIDPEKASLSTHVLSRNICQDSILNTAAYCAGPGEIAYLAQMKKLYENHETGMPVILPRYMGTLIEPKIGRAAEQLNTDIEKFILTPKDRITQEIFSTQTEFDAKKIHEDLRNKTDEFVEQVKQEFQSGDQALESDIKELSKNIRKQTDKILGNVRARQKQDHDVILKRASRVSDALLPKGSLQERTFNILQYMNMYGGTVFVQTLSQLVKGSEQGHELWQINR